MNVIRRRGWEIPESQATPENLFFNRRAFLTATGASIALAAAPSGAMAQRVGDIPDPSAGLYPAKNNPKFVLDREITPEKVNLNYNNFYEYSTSKSLAREAQQLRVRPWKIKIDGMVEKAREVDIDDVLKAMPIEERLYRHRCVEAWGMAIPWSGFSLAEFVKFCKPLSGAKYLKMETFNDPGMAPGQRSPLYPWPYVEGLTMAEATNELALLVTGAYGKPVAKQMGAPLRLAVPWKYGFKSIKSIVRFSFVDKQPKGLWEAIQSSEYGFWANVNPQVPHPRWSQASEEVIGTGERRPTLMFNGYGDFVADMYKGLEKERLWA